MGFKTVEIRNEYFRNRYIRNKGFLDSIKSVPCMDCGNAFPPVCMDFDHLGDKRYTVSQAGAGMSLEGLMREVSKCEVVCSNCHRLRTQARRSSVDRHPDKM